jgi:hypothetical protein
MPVFDAERRTLVLNFEVCHYITQPLVELYEGCIVVLKVS